MDPKRDLGGDAMRIGVDAHVLGAHKTGNERFVEGILGALATRGEHEVTAFVTDPAVRLPDGVARAMLRPAGRVARHTFALARAAAQAEIDVLLTQYLVPWRPPCPVVPVIHDVSFATNPEYFSPSERRWMRLLIPASAKRAAHVLTVSAFSKQELMRECGLAEDGVTVAYDGVDLRSFPEEQPAPSKDGNAPYFLAVGNLQPRKNLTTLIRAYAGARVAHPDFTHELLIVGQDAWGSAGVHEAARDVPGVRFLGYVDDEALSGLMRRATALAYPSRYEGFGLPVIEAMALGTPTIVADISVMREITGEAALRVPVDDVARWSDALVLMATDASLRDRLGAAGRANAARFTWAATAEIVTGVLERVARPGTLT